MSRKKLFTLAVEDQFSSREDELLSTANEAALEYAQIYNWTNTSVVRSSLPPKITGRVVLHYFDIFGLGDSLDFESDSTRSVVKPRTSGGIAAKDLNP